MKNLVALIDSAIGSKSKCDSLVCIHAYISGSAHVPRVFVPDTVSPQDAVELLEILLLTHPLQVAQKTYSRARQYVNGYINEINSKNALLQDIEAVLESNFGPGKIVYEESRFTPYGGSIYDNAHHLITLGSANISSHTLLKRENARKRAPNQKKSGTPSNPIDRALRSFYEQQWALSWMPPSVYLVSGDSTKTVQTIWTHHFSKS